jgi:hypothetical protein
VYFSVDCYYTCSILGVSSIVSMGNANEHERQSRRDQTFTILVVLVDG